MGGNIGIPLKVGSEEGGGVLVPLRDLQWLHHPWAPILPGEVEAQAWGFQPEGFSFIRSKRRLLKAGVEVDRGCYIPTVA